MYTAGRHQAHDDLRNQSRAACLRDYQQARESGTYDVQWLLGYAEVLARIPQGPHRLSDKG